ncbi:MAG: RNA polymerase factor sigma-54 [Alcaligenaceae bacterium]|nr:RNA polymerase factor sigma-54 [Alcaligenaceae bacterium]
MQSRQSLELGQHQQLVLTPQLQQAIRLLQCSSYELEQETAQALLDNPMLEAVEEPDAAEQARLLDRWWDRRSPWAASDDIPETAEPQSIQAYLLQQLHLTRATARDQALVAILIGELDERGYLAQSLEALADGLPTQMPASAQEWRTALKLLQSFDPPGIGARSLGECLVRQLDRLEDATGVAPEVLACAREMADRHLDLLATGRIGRLCRELACAREVIEAAHALLRRLEPRPAGMWGTGDVHYIVPDVLIHKQGGQWMVSLNPALAPRVRINEHYAGLIEQSGEAGPMREQLQQAHGFMRGLGQRHQTVQRVAQAIADHQRAFLEDGPGALRPLILREIAGILDMHESTVSRATRMKYAQTPWGVLELKRFFSNAVQTDSGTETSAPAVQALIRAILAAESAERPWSDSQIVQRLAGQGVTIARRTVAKYREAMDVPVASLRKIKR